MTFSDNKVEPISPVDQKRADEARMRASSALRSISRNPARTFPSILEEQAVTFATKTAIIFQGRELSYAEFNARINQYARWARDKGLRAGDRVAVMMENGPDYLALWLGLSRMGAIASLINTNLSGTPLLHAFKVSEAKRSIISKGFLNRLDDVKDHLPAFSIDWHDDNDSSADNLNHQVTHYSKGPLASDIKREATVDDVALYVFTSGTTGNPKAAKLSHRRILILSAGVAAAIETTPEDVSLCTLPMYHASGGICAPGLAFLKGGTLVIEKSFSASRFWDICNDHGVTLFEYVGEVCRYLANSPSHPKEKNHKIRAFAGAGLRKEVWRTLRERFQIPWILEFYGATEGNVSMTNFEGRMGALGRVTGLDEGTSSIQLVKLDGKTGNPLRSMDGHIQLCTVGEAGEAIGRISSRKLGSVHRFEGYTDKTATIEKILRNVLEDGDAWYRTGDTMMRDEDDFFFFVDRIGDTFRWKSENVSTMEVADILTLAPGVTEACVYGVGIPGQEGRAGMATLTLDPNFFEMDEFSIHVSRELTPYARPVFLRLTQEVTVTGNYKYRKVEFVDEGYDIERITDDVYVWDKETQCYSPLSPALFKQVNKGTYPV